MIEGALRVQSKLANALKLELQAANMGVGTEVKLSARGVCILNCWAVPPAQVTFIICDQFGGSVAIAVETGSPCESRLASALGYS